MREYETIILVKPDIGDEPLNKLAQRVKGIIDAGNGKFVALDNWGKRKLAYDIEKYPKAVYLHTHYLGASDLPKELERNLRITDDVIRYMTIVLQKDVDAGKFEAKALETLKVTNEVEDDGKFGGRHDHQDEFGGGPMGDDFAGGFEEEAV